MSGHHVVPFETSVLTQTVLAKNCVSTRLANKILPFADPAGFYAHSGDAHWESPTPSHPRRTFEYLKEGTLENT